MKVGIIGRTNVGKSTMFMALTLEGVEIADRPFTTIEPNRGVGHVRTSCPEKEFKSKCNPHNSPCVNGYRFVPVDVIDVAGLIAGAHEGKGLGNKFLSDAMEADALIEVIDISGKTNEAGLPTSDYDPGKDVEMVENELVSWFSSLILSVRYRDESDISAQVHKVLSGLKIHYDTVKEGMNKLGIKKPDDKTATELARYILSRDKPMIVACNKMDIAQDLDQRIADLKKRFKDKIFVACSAGAELTLREAHKHGFIEYDGKDFRRIKPLTKEQETALGTIEKIIKKYGSTGVQDVIDTLVFKIVGAKVVFTVEDEKKLVNSQGMVLPDAYVIDGNATPKDVAEKVHSEVAKNYKGAIDCKTGLRIKSDEPVKNGEVIKILI